MPCLLCQGPTNEFLDFGPMPIANGFLTPQQIPNEPFQRLAVAFCPTCCMVQLTDVVEPSKMFHENYAFFSSTSQRMAEHFRAFAHDVERRWLGGQDPFVVELGSNDGIMLQHFARAGRRHLGVEPSANVAEAARKKGVRTVSEFFTRALAARIKETDGGASAILGANVFCHIPALDEVMAGVALLLRPKGILVFEDPYLGDIVQKTSYDQIYDEHVFYFSLTSVSRLVGRHGLEVVRAEPQPVHGGSMRYTVARRGDHAVDPGVPALLERERAIGLDRLDTFEAFRSQVERSRQDFVAALQGLKAAGKRVVGYGATSKSTTVTNYCRVGPELVEFISDTTPTKQGKLNPGTHIPVRPYEDFARRPPDVALLFAWNHAEEILAKETRFREGGGKFLVYVPEVRLL